MYLPLNIKTDNYLQNSMIKIDDLVDFAKKNNLRALTITDNNLYGAIAFYNKCITNNIKPIIGLEITLNSLLIILYAKNYNGYLNLIKLSTIQSENNITLEIIKKYINDLIIILPFDSMSLYQKLDGDMFVSYKNDIEKKKIPYRKVYMNSINCIYKKDTIYLKYLEAIKIGISYKFIDKDYCNNYLNLKNLLEDENNNYILNNCNVKIKFHNNLIPKYKNKLGIDSFSYLKKLCILGAKNKFGNKINKKYQDRLKYELSIINKMGFSDYFLIVADYVNYAKNNNIIVGSGRGSAVSSLVSYLLNITDIDPLKYNLLFERFLNPERISMPDIDIDFEHEKRQDVINYCINKYGKKKVVPIIAFLTLGAKGAIRDVGRCLNIDLKQIDSICKLIDSNLTLRENYNNNNKLQVFLNRKKELLNVYRDAIHFEGLKRHTTIHAAGIIISSVELDNIIPLDFHNTFYTSGYDMTYLEDIGLLKMDFLAIKYLTIIHNIIDLVNKNHNICLNFDSIKIDTFSIDIFTNADTVGIFQFESPGMIKFLRKMKPNCFDDIIAAIALYRPGPMKNIDIYINRKNNHNFSYIHDSLRDILKSTYGIIIYQEQIMQIAQKMASYSLGEADILRKAMSKKKKDLLESQKEIFTKRSLKNGYDEKTISDVFNTMLKFAEYGFNKSHSVAYSTIALKMAYLKAHYRAEFYSCLLDSERGNKDKIRLYIYELRKHNINIMAPDINYSNLKYTINNNSILYPLSGIKNVSNAAQFIIEERKKGLFKDIFDFISRCYGKIVNKKVLESLILAGTFSSFNYNRKTLFTNLDIIINYGELIKDYYNALKPDILEVEEFSKKEIMQLELEYFGFYLQNNPITICKSKVKTTVDLNNIEKYFDKNISLVLSVDNVKEVETKNKEKMAFINASDELSDISVVLFPKIYQKYHINNKDIIFLKGRVEKRFDKYQIIANYLEKMDY